MLDELMSRLLAAYDQYQAQVSVEIREEEEREARNAVKREQDLAFEMSLQVHSVKIIKISTTNILRENVIDRVPF